MEKTNDQEKIVIQKDPTVEYLSTQSIPQNKNSLLFEDDLEDLGFKKFDSLRNKKTDSQTASVISERDIAEKQDEINMIERNTYAKGENLENNFLFRKLFILLTVTVLIIITLFIPISSITHKNFDSIINFRNINLINFKVDDGFFFGLFIFFLGN